MPPPLRPRAADLTGRKVKVTLPGGDLLIEWRESDDHILMTGPYALDYEGTLPAELFAASPRLVGLRAFAKTFMLEAANVRSRHHHLRLPAQCL